MVGWFMYYLWYGAADIHPSWHMKIHDLDPTNFFCCFLSRLFKLLWLTHIYIYIRIFRVLGSQGRSFSYSPEIQSEHSLPLSVGVIHLLCSTSLMHSIVVNTDDKQFICNDDPNCKFRTCNPVSPMSQETYSEPHTSGWAPDSLSVFFRLRRKRDPFLMPYKISLLLFPSKNLIMYGIMISPRPLQVCEIGFLKISTADSEPSIYWRFGPTMQRGT